MRESMTKMKHRLKNQKGFTLIELMAVLVILALILLIAVPAGGALIEKAKKSSDESSIELIEKAGENAHVDGIPFDADAPEKDSYNVPTLIKEGYLKLKPDSKFTKPGEYVTKKNKGGEFVYKGKAGKGDTAAPGEPGEDTAYTPIGCEAAEKDGYICIYNAEEFNDIRNKLDGKYILMENIDLAGYPDWNPIGTSANGFTGELNGNGKSITNLKSNYLYTNDGSEGYGLFGTVYYGEFRHLNLDVDYTLAKGASATGYSYTAAGLIGQVHNEIANNPDNRDIVVDDVHVTGTIDTSVSGIIAGVIGDVDIESGDIVFSNSSFDGELTTVGSLYGLVGGLLTNREATPNETYTTTITNNQVVLTGVASRYATGAFGVIEHMFGTHTLLIDGLTIDANIAGGNVYGANEGLYSLKTDIDTTVRNVVVDGSLSSTGYAAGFTEGLWNDGNRDTEKGYHFEYLIEDLTINADITSTDTSRNVSGVFATIRPQYGTANMEIRNITVNSNMTGASVAGLIGNYNANYGPEFKVNIHDIDIAGNAKASAEYGGLIYYYEPAGTIIHSMVIDNVDISTNVTGTATIGGFIHQSLANEAAHELTVTNVNISGDHSGKNVAGWVYDEKPRWGTAGPVTYKDIVVGGTWSGVNVTGAIGHIKTYDAVSSITFDNYVFNGKMVGSGTVSGLVATYEGQNLRTGSLITFKNSAIQSDVTLSGSGVASAIVGTAVNNEYYEINYGVLLVKDTTIDMSAGSSLIGIVGKDINGVPAKVEAIKYENVKYNGTAVTN